jgi:hypothetical protein
MWLTVFKIALAAFLVVAVCVLVFVGRRRSRANRADPRWTRGGASPGYEASVRGVMPTLPLPDWAEDDDTDADPHRPPHRWPGR